MTAVARLSDVYGHAAWTKAPVFAIVINDGPADAGRRKRPREGERKRKLSFPRRSITRRHYFLPGRRYKWCSTIRVRPIDILSTDSRTRYAGAPKSAASAVTREGERDGDGDGEGGTGTEEVTEFSRRREISQGAQTTEWNFFRVARGERKADPTNDDASPRK